MVTPKQTILLIDGSHYDRLRSVFATPLDLKRIVQLAANGAPIDQALYYRDVRDEKEEERQGPLFGWLNRNGFTVKGRTHERDDPKERYGTNIVQIAVDALLMAEPGDNLMLLAGDAKLEPLLVALKDFDIGITLISTRNAPATIAPRERLIAHATRFFELADVIDNVAMRPAPAEVDFLGRL